MEITKLDDNRIEVVRTKTEENTCEYTFEGLLEQKDAIQNQKDEQIAARDAELAEIDELLGQCETLKVSAKPVIEPVGEITEVK